jgi:hypothetical protein
MPTRSTTEKAASSQTKTPARKKAAAPRVRRTSAKVATEQTGERPLISSEERQRMVAVAAYYRAEQRGFSGGSEVEDWLAAEADVERLLGAASGAEH